MDSIIRLLRKDNAEPYNLSNLLKCQIVFWLLFSKLGFQNIL